MLMLVGGDMVLDTSVVHLCFNFVNNPSYIDRNYNMYIFALAFMYGVLLFLNG